MKCIEGERTEFNDKAVLPLRFLARIPIQEMEVKYPLGHIANAGS